MPGPAGPTRPAYGTPLLAAFCLKLAAAPVARYRPYRNSSSCSSSTAGLFTASPASVPLLLVGARCASPFGATAIAASAVDPAADLAAVPQISFFKPFLSFSFCSRFSADSGDLRCVAAVEEGERRPF
ncbi:hypothetical protein M9H77_12907 [Catharanthus roseus]|uniref:Uncharacterized protein n=1 Tax=Catharanthus roseus TaxID=4058 RepID=A0ACC0BIV2_CATRO|nr:hypothetical protein M9H77_12907 [Catharanthus roseus]